MAVIKIPTHKEALKVFKPYATEIGNLVYAWAHLQEELGQLFRFVADIRTGATAFGIWHSSGSDLAQRKMLRAAAEGQFGKQQKAKDLIWLLNQIDHKLSGKRNDAIHAPVVISTGADGTNIAPYTLNMNPRAIALRGRNIEKELIWYRELAETYRLHARAMWHHLEKPAIHPWPSKPVEPSLGTQKTAKERREARLRKAQKRLPRS